MAELLVISGKHAGNTLSLPDRDIVIGRDKSCQILLASQDISRRHCLLRPSVNGLFVTDLGSRNGTFVNEQRIEEETLLQPGDVLRLGPLSLKIPRPVVPTVDNSEDRRIASWLSDDYTPAASEGDTAVIDTLPFETGEEPSSKTGEESSSND